MFQLWLILHVLGAIIAFGPNFVFPILAVYAQREPDHAHLIARISHTIEKRVVTPVAASMLVSGLLLVSNVRINIIRSPWLLAAVIVYLGMMAFAIFVQGPAGRRLVALTAGTAAGGQAAAGSAQLERTSRQLRMGGMLLLAGLLTMVVLMIVKPGGITLY